jgi:prepilin peptidase CpaA
VLSLDLPAGLSETSWPWIQWGGAIAASLVGAWTDLRTRRIPNILTGPALLCGLGASAIWGGWSAFGGSLGAAFLLACPYILLFLFAGGGAGDAKLMGAIGSWLGIQFGLAALFGVAGCGVLMAIAYSLWRGQLSKVLTSVSWATVGLFQLAKGQRPINGTSPYFPAVEDGEKMPYGIAIFAGTLLAAGGTWIWNAS